MTISHFREIFFFFFTVYHTPCSVNHLCIVPWLYHASAKFFTPTFIVIGVSTVSLWFYFLFRLSLRLLHCSYAQQLSVEPHKRCLENFFFIWVQTVKHSMPYRWTDIKEWSSIFQQLHRIKEVGMVDKDVCCVLGQYVRLGTQNHKLGHMIHFNTLGCS